MIPFFSGILVAATDDPTDGATDATTTTGDWFSENGLMIGMIVILIVLVFFMWRNSRKRRADAEKLKETMVPGAEVMTNFGLFGKIVSLDDVANTAELEVSKGVTMKVHRQTLVRVVDPAVPGAPGEPRSVEEAMAIAEREQQEREAGASADAEPKFGERATESEQAEAAEGDSKH